MRQAISLLVAGVVVAGLVVVVFTILSSLLWALGIALAVIVVAGVIYALLSGRSTDVTIRRP